MEPLFDKLAHLKLSSAIKVAAVVAIAVEVTLCGLFGAFGEFSILGDSNDIGTLTYCLHLPGLILLSFFPFGSTGWPFFTLLISFTTVQWFLLAWGFITLLKIRTTKYAA